MRGKAQVPYRISKYSLSSKKSKSIKIVILDYIINYIYLTIIN